MPLILAFHLLLVKVGSYPLPTTPPGKGSALEEVLTGEAFARTPALGERLAEGLEAAIGAGRPWSIVRLYAHAGYVFAPQAPRNGAESRAADHPELRALTRVYMANRGVWEAGWWRAPAVSWRTHRTTTIR